MHLSARKAPTVLSAFTGVGGLDLGLEYAGFRVVGCIEFNKLARGTIGANRPTWKLLTPHDITELAPVLTPRSLNLKQRELSLLSAGPPCQPFSKAAQWAANGRRGLEDPRCACLQSLFTLVERFLPCVVLVENVPGFANGRNGAVPKIEDALGRINQRYKTKYELCYRVFDAVDYGVPQQRRRVILLARRDGERFDWPGPTHANKPVRAYDALANLSVPEPPSPAGKWASLLPTIPEGMNYLWHTPEGGGKTLFGYRTRFWSFLLKLAKDRPAWTVPAHPGPSTGPFHWKNRPLAVAELLRLQSFPASWQVMGGHRAQVVQIGNATPPLLAEVIGRGIGEQLFGLRYDGPPLLHIARKQVLPPPEQTCEVPEEYLKYEGLHPPHPGPGRGPKPCVQVENEVGHRFAIGKGTKPTSRRAS